MSMDAGVPARLEELAGYQEGSVVSRQLVKNPSGSVTVFAFDEGEGLSEHTTPHDALVTVLDGEADISVLGDTHRVAAGESILLPGGKPHALSAPRRFKMALVMLKQPSDEEG